MAAPTTSLPEEIGGVRNWDYRYTWVRDAAFTGICADASGIHRGGARFRRVYSGARQGRGPEIGRPAQRDVRHRRAATNCPKIDTRPSGRAIADRAPVRIGNAAVDHLQLDIYGELMDSIYLYRQVRHAAFLRDVDTDRAAAGLGGARTGSNRTRASGRCAAAGGSSLTRSCSAGWRSTAGCGWRESGHFPRKYCRGSTSAIESIAPSWNEGWNEKTGAFTQYFGTDAVDASALMMPLVLFVSPQGPAHDFDHRPHSQRTVVGQPGASLPHRRSGERRAAGPRGVRSPSAPSGWWRRCRAPACWKRRSYSLRSCSPMRITWGCSREEISAKGEMLGNFPQALTHLGLISAAYNLDRLLDGK